MSFLSAKSLFQENESTKEGLVDRLVDGLVESKPFIIDNPKVSKRKMVEHIGISTTATDNNIKTLKEKGIIECKGSDRTGYWQLITKK
ncbi:MAG: hypothetical protein COA80_16310 [Leeuwenhoekiella sp.]|nr:MAG: hypothetical protein COA80_16310 [Leeuwenhoekiella sp.]